MIRTDLECRNFWQFYHHLLLSLTFLNSLKCHVLMFIWYTECLKSWCDFVTATVMNKKFMALIYLTWSYHRFYRGSIWTYIHKHKVIDIETEKSCRQSQVLSFLFSFSDYSQRKLIWKLRWRGRGWNRCRPQSFCRLPGSLYQTKRPESLFSDGSAGLGLLWGWSGEFDEDSLVLTFPARY